MATLTIRNIDPAIKERLRVRAAGHGRSMEAELRAILNETVETGSSEQINLAEAIRRRFAPFGGVDDLEVHPRSARARAAALRRMIVLDTNVISELMRSQPHPLVLAWTASQPRASLYTTSINCAEILFGIGAMPKGPASDGSGERGGGHVR